MAAFLTENLGTIIVALLLAVLLALAAAKLIKDKKSGKSSCGNNCGCCPHAAVCHSQTCPEDTPKTK